MSENAAYGEITLKPEQLIIRRPEQVVCLEELSEVADLFRSQVYEGTFGGQKLEEIMMRDYHTVDREKRLRKTDALLQWFVLDHVLTYGDLNAAEFVDAVSSSDELKTAFLSFRRRDPEGLKRHAWAATHFIDDLISRHI